MKKILALSTALVLALSLLCAGALALEAADIVGTWYLNLLEGDGMSVNPAVLGMEMAITLNEDNTADMQMSGQEGTHGTWAIVDGQLIVTVDEDGLAFALVDGDLVGEEGDMKMIFGREKAEAEGASPARTDAVLADFGGTWEAFLADYEGMKVPVEMFGLEVIVAFEGGKGTMTTFGVTVELVGDVAEGVLTVAGTDAGEEVSLSFLLHEDGTLSSVFEEGVTLFFQRAN